MGNNADQVNWGKVILGAGVAMVGVAALVVIVAARLRLLAPSSPPSTTPSAIRPIPPRLGANMHAAGTAPTVEDAACDPHLAPAAMLRERGTGAGVAGRAIRMLEIFNGLPQDSIHVLGWHAEDSDEGPPCYATFAYEMRGVRHTARFKFWPRAPARLATANAEAGNMADMIELLGVNGVSHSQEQLDVASLIRVGSGMIAEDAYMSPRDAGELLIRRQHCVAGNVDYSGRESGARAIVRAMRRARITRVRCVADNPWTADISPHGTLAPPYIAEPDGGIRTPQ